MIPELFGKIHARQKSVQQHSGDWAMTGEVPVARDRKANSL
jgi:hypothetical protein